MIKVSKLADYAVVVLAALARSDSTLMTASGISAGTGLPEPTVAKVLKLLSKNEILHSARGVNGGYRLAMTPDRISVARIISAVDGPVSITACADGSTTPCNFESRCAVKGRWNGVNRAINGALTDISLAEMIGNWRPVLGNESRAEVNS